MKRPSSASAGRSAWGSTERASEGAAGACRPAAFGARRRVRPADAEVGRFTRHRTPNA